MSGTRPTRIGHCSLCRCAVFRRGENGDEKLSNRKPHHHKRDYTIIPEQDEPDHGHRGWHDFASPWV